MALVEQNLGLLLVGKRWPRTGRFKMGPRGREATEKIGAANELYMYV